MQRIEASQWSVMLKRPAQASWLDLVMHEVHVGQISTEPCFQHECVL